VRGAEVKACADYDQHTDIDSENSKHESPRPAELQQFDAFLKRELPRTIRKTLQTALESRIGPIEETLKNELESIVRDAQETLTRSYLSSAQTLSLSSGSKAGPTEQTASTQSSLTDATGKLKLIIPNDALSPYSIPPEANSSCLPQIQRLAEFSGKCASSSDSAYYSSHYCIPEPKQGASVNDIWLDSLLNEDLLEENERIAQDNVGGTTSSEIASTYAFTDDQPTRQYSGKGKGRADDDWWDVDPQY
jgi:hypothetical protein